MLILIHRVAWYLTLDNLGKNRILHGSSIREGGARAQGYPLRDIFVRHHICYNESRPRGEVQEWLNWPLSKSGKPQGFEGSNPSLSAMFLILLICRLMMLVDFLLRKTTCLLYFCSLQTQSRAIKNAHRDDVRICLCEKRAKYYWLGGRSTGVAAIGRRVDVTTRDDGVNDEVHRRIG